GEVRTILGPATKIGYAADWSEYFGYQDGSGDLFYHLDPLWADPEIDFVGIDNYMPLSDWREGETHLDAGWGSIYGIGYLQANIEGGEGYDWYYANTTHRDAQIRTPISDTAYGEDWIWRVKDIRNWWLNAHFDRIGGSKQAQSPWVPESKPVWFMEFGCAAIDKGSNEPNRFLDPKSAESGLPAYSNGRRDDLMQMQYLRAVIDYWEDPARNPVSSVYAGPMIDMAHAHVWAWDARPFPLFPTRSDLWSDGDNYAHGHWLNGRVSGEPLSSVVAEICARSGVTAVGTADLHGAVRGYAVADVGTGRAALQPLMLAYGFDAVERGGMLLFRMREGRALATVGPEALAVGERTEGLTEVTRASQAEVSGRMRLSYVEAEGSYEARAVEAILPDDQARNAAQSEIALAMTRAEAQRTAERWLTEARVARDVARFALPPSLGHLGAGDVVTLATGGGGRYRIDRVEQAGAIEMEAIRVEPGVYIASDEAEERLTPASFDAPLPVFSRFLDLPLMTGNEVPQAPHLAASADPWPGSVAVYASDIDAGYSFNKLIEARAVVGQTETLLEAARPGVWDRGPALRVRVSGGALASESADRLLNGANLMAIGDGSSDNWELFQFADAVLVAPDVYELSMRLRGQAGSDAIMPANWPVGSQVVLMDGAPRQIELLPDARDLARHYRIGPSGRSFDDASYTHDVQAFRGIGLRPLSPAHLRVTRTSGDLDLSWIRRTRTGGDSWSGLDVPLGETQELYLVRVMQGGTVLREMTVTSPFWTYGAALQVSDGAALPYEIHVAQLSDSFGPGAFARIMINV
ncbi:MAG: glycoside hydrolase/phage tail family protein, partial [Defluviimonas sp.]|nr:glycoside hydrolase/phage tail family protein [Defluviimonas sp.]